jgi:hypothetical protein
MIYTFTYRRGPADDLSKSVDIRAPQLSQAGKVFFQYARQKYPHCQLEQVKDADGIVFFDLVEFTRCVRSGGAS